MSRKPKTNAVFVGTDWSNMVVVRNNEGQSAPTIQRRLLCFASKFGYKNLTDELTSGNWTDIYSKALRVSEIGTKEANRGSKADPIGRRGLVSRAIIVKQDRVFLYYWNKTAKRWIAVQSHTMHYTSAKDAKSAESKPKAEEKPVTKRNTTTCRVSHLVPTDNADLTTSVINTLVRNGLFPLIIDKDERGNLSVETEAGRVLVAV